MSKLSKLHQSLLPKLRVVRIEEDGMSDWSDRGERGFEVIFITPSGGQETGRLYAKDELDAFVRFAAKVRSVGYLVEMDDAEQ